MNVLNLSPRLPTGGGYGVLTTPGGLAVEATADTVERKKREDLH